MKKITKNILISTLMTTVAATATTAMAFGVSATASASETAYFEMVEGASIRLAEPKGLRFTAEMSADVYEDLMTKESGVSKKMGMFIMPYSYVADENKYASSKDWVNQNYDKITKKIDCVFYDSADASIPNKIYKAGDNYRANGVISNLYLKNYDEDFVGIAYIAETVGSTTTYQFADFDSDVNVRSAIYVANAAYDDYKSDATNAKILEEYVMGAYLADIGVEEQRNTDGSIQYAYGGNVYGTMDEVVENATESGEYAFTIALEETTSGTIFMKEGANTITLNGVVYDASEPVDMLAQYITWASSNEDVATVNDGVITIKTSGSATITATFLGETATYEVNVIDGTFESLEAVPNAFSGSRASFAIATVNGNKVLEAVSTKDSTSDIGVHVKLDYLAAFFADPEADYLAFDVKSGATKTGSKVYYQNAAANGWTQYETGSFDSIPVTAFKTYYLPRSIYEGWVTNNVTTPRIIMVGGGLVCGGESFYLDNFRPCTQEEKIQEWYSFEAGGLRTNNGNQPLFYTTSAGAWDLGFSNIDSTSIKFTNDIVSDGNTALQFTKKAGETRITLNHTTDTDREKEMRSAGYIAYDLYVPAGSDARLLVNNQTIFSSLPTGWNTIYAKVDGVETNRVSMFYDTTASTYVIDNIRLLTEEEYCANVYGMEVGGGVTRMHTKTDKDTVFWYAEGYDAVKVIYSIAFTGGVKEIHYDTEIVHDGDYSLSFTKVDNVNWQFRADSKAYALLKNGFSFWLYCTTGINGTTTSNLLNGNGAKLNGGAGMNIPKNTWTKITLTADDIVQGTGEAGCAFLKLAGSTNGTYYIDGICPLGMEYDEEVPEETNNTVTFNAGSLGTVATTSKTINYGEEYTLPTPAGYRDFLAWKDESGKAVPMSGTWNYKGNVTLTAVYDEVLSFENGVVPTYMTNNTTLSVVDMEGVNGNKVLKISGSNGAPNLTVPRSFMDSFFEDPNVEYVAFNAKTGYCETNNFRRVTWRSNNTFSADCYENDNGHNKIKADSWKTYYFSRTDYNAWVSNLSGATATSQMIASGGVATDDFFYVDYIRPMTQEEYLQSVYSFEGGTVRNDGTAVYMYMPNAGGTWQWVSTQSTAVKAASATSELVSDGFRAVTFTLTPNVVSTMRFNSATVQMAQDLYSKTGYYAFDLYIPANANTTFTASIGGNYKDSVINEGGWRTIYCNTTTFMAISDTTGSTYAIDNFRPVTAEEYAAATNSFEMGTGGIRQTELESSNVFYYYMNNGTDYNGVKASLNFVGGSGATLSNPHFSTNAYAGTTSLAFEKTNGSMTFSMHVESLNYANMKNGFSFWIYSTVGLNGKTANNFVDGNGNKFGESGMSVSANTWTQIFITKNNFNGTSFLRLNGSTAGTIYIDGFEVVEYEEPQHYYNSVAEEELEDGTIVGLTLAKSTHTAGEGILPSEIAHTANMSYYKFNGEYGLDDYLVFDFTGNNMPILSFFNNSVTPTIYNHAQDANDKQWIVANGIMVNSGVPYGGYAGVHANRITLIGGNGITYKFDDNGSVELKQTRTSIGSAADPSPISMAKVNESGAQYRVIVGWVANGTNMNLRMIAWNLDTGVQVVNYNQGGVPKADWKGDIALFGHFGMETFVDKVYPIVNGLDNALALYTPDMLTYKATIDGDKVTLAASTHVGAATNVPLNSGYKEDMSYIAFNGEYGLNDYVVFDFTGDNFPFVSFFNNTITNTIWNWAQDESVYGWVISNGLRTKDGSPSGGITSANSSRIQYAGSYKYMYRYDDNGSTKQWRASDGSATDPSPISIRTLETVTDTYRAIIGFEDYNNGAGIKVRMYVINMVTGKEVLNTTRSFASASFPYMGAGSIILYGQFGKTTVLDRVFGVEEDTTLDAVIAKYAKDTDYSDEAAVTLDRYGYSSITNGNWQIDGSNQVTNPTDYREIQSTYDTYAASGLNVFLPQMAFDMGNDGNWANVSRYMDMAAKAGLKVILTDWQIQVVSTPLKVSSNGIIAADSTYKPWVIASDVNSDGTGKTAEVQAYLDALAAYGLTADTTRFKDQNALDNFIMSQVKNCKNHEAFYGLMLGDEPTYANAYCYGQVYRAIKRVLPDCYVQYNLLPLEQNLSTIKYRYPGLKDKSSASNTEIENAYKAYVTGFIDAMGTDYIQYDDYPFKSAEEGFLIWKESVPYVDNTSLRNIQLVAEIAKERNLAVKVVTQTSIMRSGGEDGPVRIRKITENDARWLNNYLTGFGVSQINYFTYFTKASNSSSGEWFEDGGSFVNRDGSTTAIYDIMKTIMAENDAFAPTISNFKYNESQVFGANNDSSLDNAHISWSASLTATKTFKWLSSVTTSKEYTLVTELYDAKNCNYMYMFMNTIDTYYGGTQSVTVTLNENVKAFYVYAPNGTRTLVEGNTYTVSLTAGQAIYVMPCQFN